ncbi:MAG: hypothetical protein PHF36_05290, partial [Candidatus Cloacimonetes bacterium]|nr:hypothetical protein [Candidatus Cloacimonadota bacterium]
TFNLHIILHSIFKPDYKTWKIWQEFLLKKFKKESIVYNNHINRFFLLNKSSQSMKIFQSLSNLFIN